MELCSRPARAESYEDTQYENPGFFIHGRIGFMGGPNEGKTGVRFTFEVPRGNGETQFEVTLMKDEILALLTELLKEE